MKVIVIDSCRLQYWHAFVFYTDGATVVVIGWLFSVDANGSEVQFSLLLLFISP